MTKTSIFDHISCGMGFCFEHFINSACMKSWCIKLPVYEMMWLIIFDSWNVVMISFISMAWEIGYIRIWFIYLNNSLAFAMLLRNHFNSLWPSDAIWEHRFASAFAQARKGLLFDDTKPLPEPMLTYHQNVESRVHSRQGNVREK